MLFNRRKRITVDLIDFSIQRISTGQISSYIVDFLYEELGFKHIGYRVENVGGDTRCVLFTLQGNKAPVQYFKDRCSGMIEEKVETTTTTPTSHKVKYWPNGFIEICG